MLAVGSPIHVERNENPTQEDIDDLHKKYVDALVTLFESHKDQYASDPSKNLTIVWLAFLSLLICLHYWLLFNSRNIFISNVTWFRINVFAKNLQIIH